MNGWVTDAKEAELLTGEFLSSLKGHLELVSTEHILAGLHLNGEYLTLVAWL